MRSVFLTGASSGLGAALTALAAGRGIAVYAFGRAPVPHASWISLDLNEPGAVSTAVANAVQKDGLPDAVICCAAIARSDASSDDEWSLEELFRVNAVSHLRLAQELSAAAEPAGHPLQIVFVSSLAAHVSFEGLAAYGVSKAALEAGAAALRWRLANTDVQVSVLRPGPMRTPFFERNRLAHPPSAQPAAAIAELVLKLLERGMAPDVTIGADDARRVAAGRRTELVTL